MTNTNFGLMPPTVLLNVAYRNDRWRTFRVVGETCLAAARTVAARSGVVFVQLEDPTTGDTIEGYTTDAEGA